MTTKSAITKKTAAAKKPTPVVKEAAEAPLGNPQGLTLAGSTGAKVAEVPAPAAPAEQPAPKKAATKKADKPKDDTLRIRLYAKGEFYFGKLASARIGSFTHVAVAVDGKKVTMTPTKSTKDTTPVMHCHAAKVLRVAKLLAETGWSKTTQDLVAKPVGDAAMTVEVK
jgi:hypothetical protein